MQKLNPFMKLSSFWNTAISIVLAFTAIVTLLPLILIVVISLSSSKSIAEIGYSFAPVEWSLEAYRYLIRTGRQVLLSYRITIVITVVGTVASLFVMSMYAYVLAQGHFKPRKALMFYTFFTMLFSGGLVPSYMINVNVLGLYDNFLIFILPSLVAAFNVIILRTFIRTTIPETLFEAAKIDGANDPRIFFQIVLPLFKPGLATIGLFNVVTRWNDWFTGMLYTDNPKLVPLQTMLTRIQQNVDFIKNNAAEAGGGVSDQLGDALRQLPSESMRMAIAIVSVIPILFAYPFFQRYFITGLTIGSVKE
ncbi:MAG: carbohydrate ABC transporter permease [Eubacteriales bacterium]|jgi:putative aldouronate transport system permease protein|nr:carbohydrate ABC transporter permease [Eubacteriales bacterium]